MDKNDIKGPIGEKKKRKSTPVPLLDGTMCYTKSIRYPDYIMDALRKIFYEDKLENMTEAVFCCIEGHRNSDLKSSDIINIKKSDAVPLTIRFREKHHQYIMEICKEKGLKTFSSGVIQVVYEYLKTEKRL